MSVSTRLSGVRYGLGGFVAAAALLAVAACGTEQPIGEADKALFLRVVDLADLGVSYPDAEAHETFSKQKLFDGSYELRVFVADEGAHTVCVATACGRVYTLAPLTLPARPGVTTW